MRGTDCLSERQDRIPYGKAFRRMKDKTQVFVALRVIITGPD